MKNLISWFGTGSSILGSFLMAFGYMQLGYVCFTMGSVSWLIVAGWDRNASLGVLNGAFFTANIIGLWRVFV